MVGDVVVAKRIYDPPSTTDGYRLLVDSGEIETALNLQSRGPEGMAPVRYI